MAQPVSMTQAEIHDFGVEIVFNQLQKEGWEIQNVNTELGQNPQIIARKDGTLAFIAVRTAGYPHKGQLEESIHWKMMEHADRFGAIPYFASVGICNANGRTEQEMATLIRGAGYYVSYEGLVIITSSSRVQVWENRG